MLTDLIIRPPRANYKLEDLGDEKFTVGGRLCERKDVDLKNDRGFTLKCSYFYETPIKPRPCVIFLHGNCGCRLDAFEGLSILLKDGISVFCFDFSGSGLSEGQYISLGYFERDDVKTVVEYLRGLDTVTTIGLWGRSMGAATAIMYVATDPSIGGMVLDSPFSSLPILASELVCSSELPIQVPKVAFNVGMKAIRKSIINRAGFNINELVPLNYVESCYTPALFLHGLEDTFILPKHCEILHEKYPGDKNIIMIEGNHNSIRPHYCYDSISIFFHNTLCSGNYEIEEPPSDVVDPDGFRDFDEFVEQHVMNHEGMDDQMIQQALLLSLEESPLEINSSTEEGSARSPAVGKKKKKSKKEKSPKPSKSPSKSKKKKKPSSKLSVNSNSNNEELN